MLNYLLANEGSDRTLAFGTSPTVPVIHRPYYLGDPLRFLTLRQSACTVHDGSLTIWGDPSVVRNLTQSVHSSSLLHRTFVAAGACCCLPAVRKLKREEEARRVAEEKAESLEEAAKTYADEVAESRRRCREVEAKNADLRLVWSLFVCSSSCCCCGRRCLC